MNAVPRFEALEDRIVLDAEPTVTIDAPPEVMLGELGVDITLTFDNTDDTDTGYAPYIDLILPTAGPDGYDGVTFDSATFLGTPVTATEIEFDDSGQAVHPMAVDSGGNPLVVTGTPGDTLVVLELPFGSFTPANPPADVVVTLDFSELSDIDQPISISATGGFALGQDGLDNPADDPSIVGPTASATITQELFTVDKTNSAPENEAVTGPNYPYTYSVEVDIAPGQTLTDFTLTDTLPHSIVYLGNVSISGGTGTVVSQPTVGDPIGLLNDQLEIEFASITGTVTVTYDFYIAEETTFPSTPVIDPASGDRAPVENSVTGAGTWDPLDENDDEVSVTDTDTDILQAASLAVQKQAELVEDNAAPGASPGDIYEFTLDIEVSDYFTMGDLEITDILGNGWSYVAGSAVFTTVEQGQNIGTTAFVDGDTLVSTFDPATGETTNVFDLSGAMIAAGQDGLLTGDLADGVWDGSQTRVLITYRALIENDFTGGGPIGQGDSLGNDVEITATVRDNDDPATTTGTEEDGSSAGVDVATGVLNEKSVYAVNGVTDPDLDEPLAAGDTVTFSIIYGSPVGSFENLVLTDNLPLPIFDVSELTTFNFVESGTPPAAGQIQFGPLDDWEDAGGGVPTLTLDPTGNSFTLDFGDFTIEPRAAGQLQVLFTLTIQDVDFADQLLLTNQATASETDNFGNTTSTTGIAQFVYAEPVVSITKGVIAAGEDDPDAVFTGSTGPVAFTPPGSAGPRWTGTINSDGLAASPVDANLQGADAGDLVSFAIVLENTGHSPHGAFNLQVSDTLPEGFVIPPGGLNLTITDGTGTRTIAYLGDAEDLFTTGIELVDRPDEGALSDYDPTSGDNVIVITYDLLLDQAVPSTETIVNTATLSNFSAWEGTPDDPATDHTPVDLTDDASVQTQLTVIDKSLESREFGEGGPDEVMVGEEFTYTITIDLAEATFTGAIFTDTVTAGGLELISGEITGFDAASMLSTNGLGLGSTAAAAGGVVTFDFGTLVNLGDNDLTNDTITIEVTARTTDAGGVAAGDLLQDTATFQSDGGAVSDSADLHVIEPNLTLDKAATPPQVIAGDTITYTVDVDNVAGAYDAPAHDLVLTDALHPFVVLDAGSVVVLLDGVDISATAVVTGNSAGDTTIEIVLPELTEGQSLAISYTATATDDVEAGEAITNTADLTYDSLPTEDPDERDYELTDSATVFGAFPTLVKSVLSTSNPDTTGTDLAIGEVVTFEIVATLPDAITLDASIQDFLPAGATGTLTLVSSQVISIGADISGSNLAVGDSGVGPNPLFEFGDLTNVNNGVTDENDQIVVHVTAILTDLPENAAGNVLTNSAVGIFSGGTGTQTATVAVVEPELDIDKTADIATGDAGDVVTYTLTSTNDGTGPAYDVVIDDDLADTGLAANGAFVPTIVIVDADGNETVPGPADATVSIVGGALHVEVATLLPGETVRVVYQAVITDAAEFDGTVENTAVFTSFDSNPLDGRTYDADLAGYVVPTDTVVIETPALDFTKTIADTSFAETDGADVSIGEIVTYDLTIELPEGSGTLTVADALPEGLVALSAEVLTLDPSLTSNLAQGDTNLTAPGDIFIGPDGGFVFNLDLVNPGDNDAANDTIVLRVTARVDDIAAVNAGTTLTNTATTTLIDPDTGLPRTDPDTGLPLAYTDSETVTVVGPALDIDKSADVSVADAGDVVTYTVTSTNTGSGPAYDVIIEDPLADTGLAANPGSVPTVVILDAGGAEVTPAGPDAPSAAFVAGALTVNVPVLEAGYTVEIVYEAVVTDAANFSSTVANTAQVTRFDTDPAGTGADPDDGRVYDADLAGYTLPADTVTLTTPDLVLTKAVTATDIAATAGTDVVVGETVTYQLVVTLPQGSGELLLTDALPDGLAALTATVVALGDGTNVTSANIAQGDTDASAAITIGPGGDSVSFDFGLVTVLGEDDAAATDTTIVIEVTARVEDVPAVADGAALTNTATLAVTDPDDGSALQPDLTGSATVEVVEPLLTLDKTGPVAVNAGDEVPYTLTIENTGTGPAFDIVVADDLADPWLSLFPGSVVATIDGTPVAVTVTPDGDGFTLTVPELDPGSVLVVTYTAVLDADAPPANAFPNTASADYDTVPGSDPLNPGRPGEAEDDHSVASGPLLTKTVTGTSFAETGSAAGDPALADLNVGEEVTYTLELTLPEIGMTSVVLTDILDAGLEFVSGTVVSVGAGITGADAPTITADGQTVTFDFGAVVNPSDGTIGADDVITIEIVARVADVPSATDGAVLDNSASLVVTPAGEAALDAATAEASIEVVEPLLVIDKTGPAAADPGDVVTYQLTVTNEGDGVAYDVSVADLLADPALTLVPGSITATLDGVPVTPVPGADGFTLSLPVVMPGSVLTVSYQALLEPGAAPASQYVNTATVDYDSVPGTDPTNPGRPGSDSDDHVLGSSPVVTKAAISTSIAETGSGQHDPALPDLTVGEEVSYDIVLTLPEIAMDSVVVVDTLDPGLSYVSATVTSVGAGILGATASVSVSGQVVTIDFGNVVNPFDGSVGADDQITITLVARVADVPAATDGAVLTNTAALTVTPANADPLDTQTDTADIEVVEPLVAIDKAGPVGVNPGDAADYSLTITNTGTAPAFDVLVTDTLANPWLSLVPGSVTVTLDGTPITPAITAAGDGFALTVPVLEPGSILLVSYEALLDPGAPAANSFVNTATAEFDTVPDGNPDTPTARPGEVTDSHSVATIPGLSKVPVATGFAETGAGQHDPRLLDLNVGETVTWRLTLTLPEIAMDAVSLTDLLGPGLEFVSASLVSVGTGILGAGDPTITVAGQAVTFDFGAVLNPSDGSIGADDRIVIEIVGRVADTAAASDGAVLVNGATLRVTPDGEAPFDAVRATSRVEVVEPDLVIDKTGPLAVDPGDTIDYQVTVVNRGTGVAYDVVIGDVFADPDLTFHPGSVSVTLDGVAVPFTAGPTGYTISVPLMPPGAVLVVTYQGVLSADAAPAESHPNTATVDYDSAPGTDPAAPGRAGEDSDVHRVAANPTITKTVIATGMKDTGSAEHDPSLPDLAIGETVTYDLVVTLPEIAMDRVVIVETMAPGLEFVSAKVTGIGAGITGATPTITVSGQVVTIDFGDVVNPFDGSIGADDRITVSFVARVADVPAARDGATLDNTAALTVTPEGQGPLDTRVDSASVEVVEPQIVLDKTVSDPEPMVGDTVTFTVTLANDPDATAPAYNLVVTDPLPDGLLLTGHFRLSDPSLGTISTATVNGQTVLVATVPRLMPGQSLTIEYEVFIDYATMPLEDLVNTATVDGGTTPDPSNPGRGIDGSDDATINPQPVPYLPDEPRHRPANLGIDDAYFAPDILIDPIYTGVAAPGSNLTLYLYGDDGSLLYVRNVMTDADGSWIVVFPRVNLDQSVDDPYAAYNRSRLFEVPVTALNAREPGTSPSEAAIRFAVTRPVEDQFSLRIVQDRASDDSGGGASYAHTFYGPASAESTYGRGGVLRVNDVFEDIASHTVERLYDATLSPMGPGLNRFNYEFLTGSTAVPGGYSQ